MRTLFKRFGRELSHANEARDRLGLEPISGGDEVFIAANLFPLGGPEVAEDEGQDPEEAGKDAYGIKEEVDTDTFTTRREASARASEIGCVGTHQHTVDGKLVFMPCDTHSEYESLMDESGDGSKAESDVDTVPTSAMAKNAERGLELRKEYNRGGTEVGVARAVQLRAAGKIKPKNCSAVCTAIFRAMKSTREQKVSAGVKLDGLARDWLLGCSGAVMKVNLGRSEKRPSLIKSVINLRKWKISTLILDLEEKSPI